SVKTHLTTELASCVDGSKSAMGHRKERTSGRRDRRRRSPMDFRSRRRDSPPWWLPDARIASGSTVELPKNLPSFRPSCPVNKNSGARRGGFPVFSLASSLVFVGDRKSERGTDVVGPSNSPKIVRPSAPSCEGPSGSVNRRHVERRQKR